MKRHIIGSLGVLCSLFAGSLSAQNCYECFDPCNALITVEADYLYWTAKQNDREFARLVTLSDNNTLVNVDADHAKQVREKWNSGYRIGAGYRPCDCLWSIDAVYTHFQTTGHKSANSSVGTLGSSDGVFTVGTVVLPSITPLDPVIFGDSRTSSESNILVADSASSQTKFKIDLGDINLLRHSFCSTSCFNVNFLFGIRGGRLSSHWNTTYNYPVGALGFAADGIGASTVQRSSIDWTYLAIGPRFGVVGDIDLGYGVSLYGNFSGSLVYGKLKRSNVTVVEGNLLLSDSESSVSSTIENLRKGTYKLTPVLQAEAGFAYTYVCDQFSVQGRIGVEMMSWINVAENTHYNFLSGPRAKSSVSDLDLYGLTTGVTVAF